MLHRHDISDRAWKIIESHYLLSMEIGTIRIVVLRAGGTKEYGPNFLKLSSKTLILSGLCSIHLTLMYILTELKQCEVIKTWYEQAADSSQVLQLIQDIEQGIEGSRKMRNGSSNSAEEESKRTKGL